MRGTMTVRSVFVLPTTTTLDTVAVREYSQSPQGLRQVTCGSREGRRTVCLPQTTGREFSGEFSSGLQTLLVPPHLQRESAFRGVRKVDHVPCPTPAALLVEPRGPVVPNRARKPRDFDAVCGETRLRVRYQGCRDTGAAHLCGHKQLIQLVVFQNAESHW